jgi:hypothetical protein
MKEYTDYNIGSRVNANRRAHYEIVRDETPMNTPLVIRDIGPWDRFMTVTNGAEETVFELATAGRLPAGRKLYYFDSDGFMDELKHDGAGNFLGFAPGPGRNHPPMTTQVPGRRSELPGDGEK